MRHTGRRRTALPMGMLATILLAACGGPSSSSTSVATATATPTPTSTPTPSPRPKPTPVPTPPPMASPVIIQVENLWAARPQSGLSAPDLIYEYETEGGISRFSTFWFSAPKVEIGPVRSARTVTVQLVRIYNGTLMYSGAGNYVESLLNSEGLRHYSQGSGAMYRITRRGAPHNLYTDGPHVAALMAQVQPPLVGYHLWARTSVAGLPPGGTHAGRVLVPVSPTEQPTFTWDPAHLGYTRTEPDTGVAADANTGSPWEPSTVVVLQMAVTSDPNVHDVGGGIGVDHALVGTGSGQVLTAGYMYPITWTQGDSGPPTFTLADGRPAPIAPGQVLICLTRTGAAAGPY